MVISIMDPLFAKNAILHVIDVTVYQVIAVLVANQHQIDFWILMMNASAN